MSGLILDVSAEVATQIAKNCRRRQPHCHLTPSLRGTPANIPTNLIFPETRFNHWPTFLSLIVWVYLHSHLCSGLQKTHLFCDRVHFGRSRSFKVIDFGTNRKRIYDFILVINSNHGPILHRFWDTATYWLKIAYFSYPSLIWRPRSMCSPWNFGVKLIVRKLESRGYSVVKVAWS